MAAHFVSLSARVSQRDSSSHDFATPLNDALFPDETFSKLHHLGMEYQDSLLMPSSTSRSARSDFTADEEMDNREFNGLHLELAPFGLEQVYDFESGGHHPVLLGDVYNNRRYRIIHKLGSGGFGVVWLCRDTEAKGTTKYLALKIQMARYPVIPDINPVLNESREQHHGPTAPDYLVYSVAWSDVDTRYISNESFLIDFGESFEISHPPDDLGLPGPYRSPELIVDKNAGFGSDIWALGCTLFEIRTGRELFGTFDDDDNEYLDAFVQVLGRLPEPWWSTTWEDRRRIYKNDVDEQGLVVAALASEPGNTGQENEGRIIHPSVPVNARSLKDKIAPGLWYMSDGRPKVERHREISQKEQEVLADILRSISWKTAFPQQML
ncbi:hypothetical protein IFR05_012050 [Cadophora sp. M221]|nr:hypothetical protein IFR05_012050 [Cadophora sp. M221]